MLIKENFPNQQFDSNYYYSFASLLALPFVCFNWLVKTHLFANCCNLWVVFLLYLPSYFSYIYFHHLSGTVFYTVFLFDSLHSELFLRQVFKNHTTVFLTLVPKLTTPLEVIAFALSPCATSLSVPFCLFVHESWILLINSFCHFTKFRLCFQTTVTY